MAARQDQGLVFTLITFVILFIIAFVAAYVGWKSYGESETHVAQLQNDLNQERSAKTKFQTDNEQLLKWMGVGQFDNIEDVEKSFKEDMTRYGSNFGADRQSYRNVVEYLAKENESVSAREVSAKVQLKEAKDALLAVETEKEKQVTQFETQMKVAETDAAAQRAQFKKDRDSLEAAKQELLNNLAKQEDRYESQVAEISTQLKNLTEKLTKSERAKDNLLAEVSKSSESFEAPDGRISWVNQNGTVWINLGSADALRRQITFSVFDADAQDPAKTEPKGTIEVTRILGDHMAEARISSDDMRNPILAGDQIYSQVWRRGKKLRFALVGTIDLDGDGRSDMKRARDLIELNGGVVDAYLDDDGKVVGEITVNTRYMVLGDFPEGVNQSVKQAGWQTMSEDAKTNGVEIITLDKFLNQIGYAPDERMVQLGSGAKISDFPARAEAGAGPVPASRSQFRPRTPSSSAPSRPAPAGAYMRISP